MVGLARHRALPGGGLGGGIDMKAKKVDVQFRLPKEVAERYERIVQFSDEKVETVMKVLLALQVVDFVKPSEDARAP